jgi:hypothetical protein
MRILRPEDGKKKLLIHYAYLTPRAFFPIPCYLGIPEEYDYLEMIRVRLVIYSFDLLLFLELCSLSYKNQVMRTYNHTRFV